MGLARVLALLVLALSARADVLCLVDGRIFDQVRLESTDDGVRVLFENGTVVVPSTLVLAALIEGEPEFTPRTPEEEERFDNGLVPFDGKWVTPDKRRREIQARVSAARAAVEELRSYREWSRRRREETKHFAFEYTVPQALYEDYRDKMEAYFDAFAKEWRVKPPKDRGKLAVCFYGSRKEFHRTSGAGSNVLGYFKFRGEFDLNIYFDRNDPGGTEDVMFHEANHYLQKLVDPGFSYPHWPGEALAEYYGASEWDPEKKKLETGLVQDGRLTQIQTDIASGRHVGLAELITTAGMYEHYTWGWSLVHFLMNDSSRAKRFQKFFLGLAEDKGVERVDYGSGLRTVEAEEVWDYFRAEMGLRSEQDVRDLEADWHDYVERTLKLQSSRGLELAAVAALRTDRPIRAKRLFQEAIDKGSTNPVTFHKYAEVLLEEGDTRAAVEHWQRAIALDPLNASFHMGLSQAHAKLEDATESRRLAALAREIDPDVE